MTHFSDGDYREVLQQEIERRSAKNPRYSMRAFARDLGLTPSHLWGVLAGKCGLSKAGAQAIAKELGLCTDETEVFVKSVESHHARSRIIRKSAASSLRRLKGKSRTAQRLELDQFHLIADWFHFAILEITYIRDVHFDPVSIANALGIQPLLARTAIQRLLRLKMLKRHGRKLVPQDSATETGFNVPSEAIKTFHAQILEKAAVALRIQPVEKRDFRSSVFAIRRDKLAEARLAIAEIHRKFCEEISDSSELRKKDEVYCFSSQLFSLTPDLEKQS